MNGMTQRKNQSNQSTIVLCNNLMLLLLLFLSQHSYSQQSLVKRFLIVNYVATISDYVNTAVIWNKLYNFIVIVKIKVRYWIERPTETYVVN